MAEAFRKFTRAELHEFNGEDGKPCYVAFGDKVVDVSTSKLWRNGMHMKRHRAGEDLTHALGEAPHSEEVIARFPQVGVLAPEAPTETAADGVPPWLGRFLDRHPFFKRHPHPMTVHFPIVFMIGAPVFTLLFLMTGLRGFEITAVNCLAGGLLFSLIVIPTGFLTWWLNYAMHPLRPVLIKIYTSIAMFIVGLAALVWRLVDPGIIADHGGIAYLYYTLVFLLLPMVLIVAWNGAMLTFPLRAEHRR